MANDKVERQLEQLKILRVAGPSDERLKGLAKALADRVNVVVARAATIACDWQAKSLLPDLLNAYARLFVKAPEADPQCWGKIELAKCLKELGVVESGVFVRGLQHQQLESTWGGKTDTAPPLRSVCALALVQCSDIPRHETLLHLVNALTESDASVRTDASRALEQMGGREVALLLRLKARAGDKEPRVTGQVLEGLLNIEGATGISFVSTFLLSLDEQVREESALALGACRIPEAVDALKKAFLNQPMLRNSAILLRAISASRQDSALNFLLELVQSGRPQAAQDALYALALHRDSEEIVNRIATSISARSELHELFREIYPGKP